MLQFFSKYFCKKKCDFVENNNTDYKINFINKELNNHIKFYFKHIKEGDHMFFLRNENNLNNEK